MPKQPNPTSFVQRLAETEAARIAAANMPRSRSWHVHVTRAGDRLEPLNITDDSDTLDRWNQSQREVVEVVPLSELTAIQAKMIRMQQLFNQLNSDRPEAISSVEAALIHDQLEDIDPISDDEFADLTADLEFPGK